MAYHIVTIVDWIGERPDGNPVKGHKLTVTDDDTGDTFSVFSESIDEHRVRPIIEAEIAKRRHLESLEF